MTQLSSTLIPKRDYGFNNTGRRAAYALVSNNTTTPSQTSIAFYDENFRSVGGLRSLQGSGQANADVINPAFNAAMGGRETTFGSVAGTQSNPSSNGTNNSANATNSCGEFGNATFDVMSDGNFAAATNRGASWTDKAALNQSVVISDHTDKATVYILNAGKLRAVSRLFGQLGFAKAGTADFTVPNLNANMTGSACYHAGRKELTILSYKTSNTMDVLTYSNVDFNSYPSPAQALTQAGVTLTASTITLGDINTSFAESMYRVMPTVTDDGTVFVTTMIPTSKLALSKFTRNGVLAVTATSLTSLALHATSYGSEQGLYYGQRRIASRDGSSVACFCPYYYYGSGVACFMIDKSANSYAQYNANDTGCGYNVMPFKEAGWAFYYAGNLYAANPTGASITAIYERGDSSNVQLKQTYGTRYLPYMPYPNTTNYPAMMQVVDFAMMIRDLNGELIQPYGDAF